MVPIGSAHPILAPKSHVSELLTDTAIVGLQHLLPSQVPLFARFQQAGFRPNSIFLAGKPYSTIQSAVAGLSDLGCKVYQTGKHNFKVGKYADHFRDFIANYWDYTLHTMPSNIQKIVILDEGGWLRWAVPPSVTHRYALTSVEHTMFGMHPIPIGGRAFPVVLMAASAAKTVFESPVIAQAVVARCIELVKNVGAKRIGIVGIGNIGRALALHLHANGIGPIYGFDTNIRKNSDLKFLIRSRKVSEVVSECDIIFGCSGQDIIDPSCDFDRACGNKWLASCSSGDFEFLRVASVLASKQPAPASPFDSLLGQVGNVEINLLNGGFPINFDRISEREAATKIQITRELTYASVLQAALCVRSNNQNNAVMLDPEIQKQLVTAWLVQSDEVDLLKDQQAGDFAWWEKNSTGKRPPVELSDFIGIEKKFAGMA